MVTTKEYYEKNREGILAYQAKYRAAHPEKWRNKNKRWRDANPERMKLYMATYNGSPRGKLTKLRLRAKRGNIPFDIELADYLGWLKQQTDKCHYCGNKLNTNQGHKMLDGDSIDRKDNKKGYFIGNIVLCCNRCNMIKGSWFTEQEMLEIASKYLSER